MNATAELKRANKITAYWAGTGVAVAIFYKTHDKIMEVKSDDEQLGFTMPEGTEESPVTAAQKLESFKAYVIANATALGITYDPVDRRADEFKFPSKYTEDTAKEYAGKMLAMSLEKVLGQLKTNVIDKMIKADQLPEGTLPQYRIGEPTINITESYANGSIKYATVDYPVVLVVGGNEKATNIAIELVSGQMKKPRNIGDTVLTMTGIKTMLVEGGVLPKKPEKDEKEDTAGEGEVPASAEAGEEKPKRGGRNEQAAE